MFKVQKSFILSQIETKNVNKICFLHLFVLFFIALSACVYTQTATADEDDFVQTQFEFESNEIIFVLGRTYRVINTLGAGKSGLVLKVQDLQTKEMLALKITSLEHVLNLAGVQQFEEQYAQLINKINNQKNKQHLSELKFLPRQVGRDDLKEQSVFVEVMPISDGNYRKAVTHSLQSPNSFFESVKLADKVLHEVSNDLTTLALYGYFYFDLNFDNINFDADSGRFTLIDFGGVFARVKKQSEVLIQATSMNIPEEEKQGLRPFSVFTELFSVAAVLVQTLDPLKNNCFDKVKDQNGNIINEVINYEKTLAFLKQKESEIKIYKDEKLKMKFFVLKEFVRVFLQPNLEDRVKGVSEVKLDSDLKEQVKILLDLFVLDQPHLAARFGVQLRRFEKLAKSLEQQNDLKSSVKANKAYRCEMLFN